jgi:hypothetical protein
MGWKKWAYTVTSNLFSIPTSVELMVGVGGGGTGPGTIAINTDW